ncbi:MarR family winged helix-turn-helix transcriptional regulator [Liquorilactobacillus uvarum]|uniref:MarR family winged helix-turn-helix transcriptional regulator n=1 Tax=Liquorilactobacillus uvarum TaxID=303240 RepID=UPI000ABA1713|nr:MarR family transcriptional regulator [Liquorilactobacillus uvarum]
MTKSTHEPYDELCFSVYTTNRYFHRLYSKILSQYELTYLQYMVLIVVRNEKQTSLSTICSKLDLANNTLTPVIQKLVNKNWLVKKKGS